jgi:hypothetical protein
LAKASAGEAEEDDQGANEAVDLGSGACWHEIGGELNGPAFAGARDCGRKVDWINRRRKEGGFDAETWRRGLDGHEAERGVRRGFSGGFLFAFRMGCFPQKLSLVG